MNKGIGILLILLFVLIPNIKDIIKNKKDIGSLIVIILSILSIIYVIRL